MVDQNKLQEVYAWIDDKRDDIIRELSEIASIRSVSDASSDVKPFGQGCRDVLAAMLKKGEDAGFAVHNYDNYVGSIFYDNGADEKDTFGVWAHLDVVPEGEGWLSDPYTPVIRDGLLFGRGVGDNKSAAIGTFYIQQALRACKVPMKHNIKLFLGTSEETGMADVQYYVQNYPVPKFSLVPDAGFPGACGEFGRVQYDLVSKKALSDDVVELYAGSVFNIIPNKATVVLKKSAALDLSVIPAEGYTVSDHGDTVTIEAAGMSRHAAMPEGGINAIHKLTTLLVNLPGISENDKKIFQFLTSVNDDSYGTFLGFAKTDEISGQTVSSGTVLRMTDGIVRMTNDCRHCVTDTNEHIIEQIEKTCAKYDFALDIKQLSKPYYIDKNSEAIKTVTRIYQEYTGQDGEVRIGKGGTYAGKIPMAIATGISIRGTDPAPDYIQPGHGGAHQPDEYITIKNYIEGIKLLATIILNLDEVL